MSYGVSYEEPGTAQQELQELRCFWPTIALFLTAMSGEGRAETEEKRRSPYYIGKNWTLFLVTFSWRGRCDFESDFWPP